MKYTLKIALVLLCVIIGSSFAHAEPALTTWSDFGKVRSVAVSSEFAYFATTGGIIRYSKFTQKWEMPLTGTLGINQEDIEHIWVDEFDQHLYAQTGMGLFELNLLFDQWYSITELPEINNPARRVSLDDLLFAPPGFTYGGKGVFTNLLGTTFPITDAVKDGTGVIWIGTLGQGAATSTTTNVVNFLEYGLLQDQVNTIWPDGDSIWMSGPIGFSQRSGISIFNDFENRFAYIESEIQPEFPAVDVNCITGDDKAVYFGTTDGLYQLEREGQHISRLVSDGNGLRSENVLSIAVTDSLLFLGTEEGLAWVRFFPDSMEVKLSADFVDRIIYDLEVVDSTLWLATEKGVYRVFWESGRVQQFTDKDNMLSFEVFEIERTGNELWFSAKNGAMRLNLVSGENTPYLLTDAGGSDRVLAVNDNVVAMNTFRGVTLQYYREKSVRRKDIGRVDGLPSDNIFSLELLGDYLWIGTDKGVTRVQW